MKYTDIGKHAEAKIFVVGAGGIGCELLKNLVLTGFKDIHVIDLDTIDVSNLNRQFLFQRVHVGQSKSICATNTCKQFNPDVNITTYHDSVLNPQYNVQFYKQFNVVMNALDNRAARIHVNRLCLAAGVPLIESGTGGYLGQVTVIKKGQYECYECTPTKADKSYPGCTIRNTPSEPIHCIVWAKHLFNQLFGEEDPDMAVSPDTADPEAVGDAGQKAVEKEEDRKSTRQWAESHDYDAERILHKMFHDDIIYLLSMDKLWKKRKPPTPLNIEEISKDTSIGNGAAYALKDQRPWSIYECVHVFRDSVDHLKKKYKSDGYLSWDKDDKEAMDFVTATANIRAHIFSIEQKSRFEIKSMAGNIIPAIATTNAIIAGQIVLEGMKILREDWKKCQFTYLIRQPNHRRRLIVPVQLNPPNDKCYVCREKPEVTVTVNTDTMTIGNFNEMIVKKHLGMVAPDIEVDDGKGTILVSADEEETIDNLSKTLSAFNITSYTRLKCDDDRQVYKLVITIVHANKIVNDSEEEIEFKVIGSVPEISANPPEQLSGGTASDKMTPRKRPRLEVEEDDDLVVL